MLASSIMRQSQVVVVYSDTVKVVEYKPLYCCVQWLPCISHSVACEGVQVEASLVWSVH